MDFGRLITAMVTPFDEQQQIDWDQVKRLIDYLIEEQGADSLVICGTTGESPTLTDEEKIKLFEIALKHANGRCKIIAGTGTNSTQHSIELTQAAERIGVDGILLVAPYYNRPSQEGLYEHFKAIASETTLSVMLYNVPHRTGMNIAPETTIRLSEISNIVATKEAISDFSHLSRIISEASADFKVYSGDDILTLPALSIGCYGIVSVAAHVIGLEMKKMVESYLQGQVEAAALAHQRLHPVFTGLFIAPSPAPVKYALTHKGINAGQVRLPLVGLTDEEKKIVDQIFIK